MRAVSQWITLSDGRRLVYHRRGRGPLVVCHPGGPGISPAYFADLAGLADDFELLLLEPRGTCDSERPPDPQAYEVEDFVADLEELRAQLGVEKMRLLGHSHGGFVAAAYAGAFPGRVERLVLANTAARASGADIDAALARHEGESWYADAIQAMQDETDGHYQSDEELRDHLRRELPLYWGTYDERAAAYLDTIAEDLPNGDALRVWNRAMPTFDLRPRLGGISCPTLVLSAEYDFVTPVTAGRELSAGIAGSSFHVIERCGHFSFVEAAAEFRQVVGGFLA
jgi:proline-specific peptidase